MKRAPILILITVLSLFLFALSSCASRSETENQEDIKSASDTGEGNTASKEANQTPDEANSILDTSVESSSVMTATDVELSSDPISSDAILSSEEESSSESPESINESTLDPSMAGSTEHSDLGMPEIEIPLGTSASGETNEQESTAEMDPHTSSSEEQQEESSHAFEEETGDDDASSWTDENGDILLPGVP